MLFTAPLICIDKSKRAKVSARWDAKFLIIEADAKYA